MYLGTFNSFVFTAAADTPANTAVTNGTFIGVTKANYKSGEKGVAFMGSPAAVFQFDLAAAASAAVTAGTVAYINGDNEVVWASGTGITVLGRVWKAVASGDTTVQVAIDGFAA